MGEADHAETCLEEPGDVGEIALKGVGALQAEEGGHRGLVGGTGGEEAPEVVTGAHHGQPTL